MNDLLLPAVQKGSVATVDTDPYYNLVSLHLKGDVNTGRSYNAFSDASSNNFRLTNNGDVRGSSFSPYGTSWSAYFDNTNDYVSYNTSDANLAVGASDNFCVECWVYYDTAPNYEAWFQAEYRTGALTSNCLWFGYNSGSIALGRHASSNFASAAITINQSQWYHLVGVRQAGNVAIFVNGTRVASASSNTMDATQNGFNIGNIYPNGYMGGYISNVRFIRAASGTSMPYDPTQTTISVPTSPLSAVTGTRVLACQGNRFLDASGNNYTLTVNDAPRISSFSPFLETDTTSGSGYFDGSGDYLSFTSSQSFNPNTDVYCLEFWCYESTQNTTMYLTADTDTTTNKFYIGYYSGNYLLGDGTTNIFGWSPKFLQWVHTVVTFDGTTTRAFSNGQLAASTTLKLLSNTITKWFIGGRDGQSSTNGYISNVRFCRGSIPTLYQTSSTTNGTQVFTPPSTSLTTTSQGATAAHVLFLTLQERGAYNNIGFQDESEYQHVITRPSGANVAQGTFSPFSNSGWSNLFNGSSGYISAPGDAGFAFGTDDFTIEMWVNITGTNAGLICHGPVATAGSWMLEIGGSTFSWQAAMNANLIQVSASSVLGTGWKHVAVTRASGTTRLFVDGGLLGSSSAASNFNTTTGPLWIGRSYNNAYTAGHISNVRVIKSQALYTGAFTPPANQLTATSVGTTGANVAASLTGTVSLLTCQSNRFLDQTGKTITVNGSPSVAAFSPFKPPAYDPQVHGGSGYFDDNGDYLSVANHTAFKFGTGDFTVEGWFYLPVFNTTYDSLFTIGNYTDGILMRYQNVDGTNDNLYIAGSYYNWGPIANFRVGAWNHVALVRNGSGSNNLQVYVNGISVLTATNTTNLQPAGSVFIGTAAHALADTWGGYISSFRIVKGTAVYTANFTPPSGPLPLLGNTSLLLNFTNAGVIDSTGKNVIETVGNSGVVTTAIKKYGSGSLFFDGTGDYLNGFNDSGALFLGTSYTIEFWLRLNSVSGNQNLICLSAANNSNQGINSYTTGTSITIDDGNTASTGPSGGTLAINTWYHVALVANGTNTKLFIDGTLISTYGGITRYTAGGAWKYITVGANGSKTSNYLNGYIDDLRITNGLARYIGSGAVGTTYFTAPSKALPDRGTLSTLTVDMAAPSSVEALVVAGGAAGGLDRGGGGGAGGFREFVGGNAIAVSSGTNYAISIGAGGAVNGTVGDGNDGNISRFGSVYSSAGGGGGGAGRGGRSGGSGGGSAVSTIAAGLGNSGSYSPVEGYGGGLGNAPPSPGDAGGGGGGAGGAGSVGGSTGGAGGIGAQSSITGVPTYYAGGGGGGKNGGTGGAGGQGGGGAAQNSTSGSGTAGTANTGGGGGAGSGQTGTANGVPAAGGSGVVILAYPTSFRPLKASLGLVYTIDTVTRPGYRVYRFTAGTGTISW